MAILLYFFTFSFSLKVISGDTFLRIQDLKSLFKIGIHSHLNEVIYKYLNLSAIYINTSVNYNIFHTRIYIQPTIISS